MARVSTQEGGKAEVQKCPSVKRKASSDIECQVQEFLSRGGEIEVHESSYSFSGVADMRGE